MVLSKTRVGISRSGTAVYPKTSIIDKNLYRGSPCSQTLSGHVPHQSRRHHFEGPRVPDPQKTSCGAYDGHLHGPYSWRAFKLMGCQTPKLPLPFTARRPPSNTQMPGPTTHHPKWQLARFMHFRTTVRQSPHRLQWDAPNSLPKLLLPLRRQPPPSNTPVPWPIPLTIANGIRIRSAVLPQYTSRQTDWETNRRTDKPTHGVSECSET